MERVRLGALQQQLQGVTCCDDCCYNSDAENYASWNCPAKDQASMQNAMVQPWAEVLHLQRFVKAAGHIHAI